MSGHTRDSYLLTVIANLNGIIMVLSPLLSLMEDQV
jgi:superfamily II DNA helicase RecQ